MVSTGKPRKVCEQVRASCGHLFLPCLWKTWIPGPWVGGTGRMTPGPPLTPCEDLATQGGGVWGQVGYFRLRAGNLGGLPGPMFLACREAQARWYLAGSRQEVQLNIRIGQAVGVHGLQSLQEKRRQWCESLGRAGHSAATARGAAPGLCPPRQSTPCASSCEVRKGKEPRNQADGVSSPVMSLPGCVSSGNFLNLSEPHVPRRSNAMEQSCLIRGETYTQFHL